MMTDNDPADLPEFEHLGEVQPGKRYLLRATERISPEMAERVQERLREVFPDSTFGILTPNLEPVEPIPVPDLLTAIKRAGDALQLRYIKASSEGSRIAYTGGMFALQELRKALTPKTGDGPVTPPAAPGNAAAESATGPSPLTCTCERHESPGGQVWGARDPNCPMHYRCKSIRPGNGAQCIEMHHTEGLHGDGRGNKW